MKIVHGFSRTVMIAGRWAFKVPRLGGGFRAFLCGLLSNMAEAERWKLSRDPALCPVLWSVPGGWLLVMPRVDPAGAVPERNVAGFDHKRDSYGYLDGELVAVDYHGEVWRDGEER